MSVAQPPQQTDKKPEKAKEAKKRADKGKKKVVKRDRITVDCDAPVTDGIMDTSALEKYLHDHIKVDGKAGALGTKVTITRTNNKVVISAVPPFSKRYIKFLVKKYLKKQGLREWLRVVAPNKQSYVLKYFNIQEEDDADEGENKE